MKRERVEPGEADESARTVSEPNRETSGESGHGSSSPPSAATLPSGASSTNVGSAAAWREATTAVRARIGPAARAATSLFSDYPVPGSRIGESGRFEIVERLGEGGMGHLFRAIDWHLDRTVAIKFILQNHELPLEQLVSLLKREAKVTAKLHHENIVSIFDMDAYNDVPFLVMELLDGQSLDAIVGRSPLPALRATRIMAQVARGLMHAHASGIIHRDLKPSNVFILRDGRAKILDFGISRFDRPAVPGLIHGDVPWTVSGVGTPAYMAPEQWRVGPQDGRTDIWAAGVMFYQMLCGQLPFSVPELLRLRAPTPVRFIAPSVRLRVPALPEEADRLIATALNEDPEGRYQSAREFSEALRELEGLLTGGVVDSGLADRSTPQVERRPLTVLSCVLEGLADRDLDEIIDAERAFYQACWDVVRRLDGCVGTPVGGKFFCCFGYPVARETDVQRAVHAGLQIVNTLHDRRPSGARALDFKIGIHSGIVGLANLPGTGPGIPAMQGEVPNIAARLTARAEPNGVVMSQATRDLVSTLFVTEPLPSSAAGADDERARPPAYRVVSELESPSRFELASGEDPTPFVGRETEAALLCQLWEDVKDGRGQLAVVSGDPGIGKSRLVQLLKDRVIAEKNTRLTCQCRPQFKNSALHPITELLFRSMDIHREDTREEKLQKVEAPLLALGFKLEETVPLFATLLSIPYEGSYASLGLSPELQKVRTLEALVSLLLRTALGRSTLLIIEDMHWVDHSTVEFLNMLIDVVPSARLLVVLTCRPEFRVPWSARRHLHHLALERLSSALTASMIDHVSKERKLPPHMIERLIATADGVPLFVEELTRMVVESFTPEESSRSARVAIPGTLQELLLARLDRLGDLGKEVAQLGAVLGRDFPYGLIRHVSLVDEMSLQEGLDILVAAGILYRQGTPPDSKYLFKHALIQQAAYQSLVRSDRQLHHQRAAKVLEDVFPETANLEPELLAYHHSEAGNAAEAVGFWDRAGQRATRSSALVEAIDHYTKAREALSTLPEGTERDKKELGLLLALGSPLMSVHGYATPEVEKTYARARELARPAGGQAELFPAMQGLWQFYYVRGMLPTSRALGEQLLEIAEEAADSTFLLLAHRSVASSAFLQGDFESCRIHTSSGLDIYTVRDHGALALRTGHDPGVAHGVYQAWTLWMLGYPDQSLTVVMESVALSKRLAHPMTIAYALCFAALVRNHRGDHEEALALSDQALAITTENKFALWTAWAKLQRGWALAALKDYQRGIPLMRDGLDEWKNTGARVGFTFFPVTLAEMSLRAGRPADAGALLDEATPMVERNDEHFYEAELCRLRGEVAVSLSRTDADEHFARGLALARAQRARAWELRLVLSRSRLLAARGERDRARAELSAIYQWFSEGRETGDLRAAESEIASLDSVSETR